MTTLSQYHYLLRQPEDLELLRPTLETYFQNYPEMEEVDFHLVQRDIAWETVFGLPPEYPCILIVTYSRSNGGLGMPVFGRTTMQYLTPTQAIRRAETLLECVQQLFPNP